MPEFSRFAFSMRRYRIPLLIAAILCTVCAGWFRTHRVHRELRLFPGRPSYLFSYDDRAVGGVSSVRALERIDAGLRFTFRLGPSRSAFAGAGADFSGPGRNRRGIDLSRFDALELTVRAGSPLTLKLVLTGYDSTIWKEGDYLSRRYSEARFEVPAGGRARIPLDRFVVPGWWLDRGLVPATDTGRALDQLQTVEVQAVAGRRQADGTEDTLLVKDLRAVRDRAVVGAWIWAIPAILCGLLLFSWRPVRGTREVEPVPAPPPVRAAEPVPLPLGNESDAFVERFSAHLSSNYQRTELDADLVCRETGIPRSRLPEIVKQGFGTTFKAHLNDLRLTEAARLLRSTDRGVAEIGFAVGYNSVAHFHRVFRDRHGVPPGEYRNRPTDAPAGPEAPET